MFKKRLLTATILVALVFLGILYLPADIFIVVATGLMLFAAWEWSILIECRSRWGQVLYVLFIALVMLGSYYVSVKWILSITFIWWLFAFILTLIYPFAANLWGKGIYIRGIMGVLVLVPCWSSLNIIRLSQNGISRLFFVLFLIWAADTGAYFVGKSCGKHKLMPKVSPQKTWEGFVGGVLLTLLVAIIGCKVLNIEIHLWPKILFLSLLVVLFAVVGDLFESMLKRQAGLKNTAEYLPGHGGILDRIDSVAAAMPIFLLGCFLLKLYI